MFDAGPVDWDQRLRFSHQAARLAWAQIRVAALELRTARTENSLDDHPTERLEHLRRRKLVVAQTVWEEQFAELAYHRERRVEARGKVALKNAHYD